MMDEKTRRALWKQEVRERVEKRLEEIEKTRFKSFEERITMQDIRWLASQHIVIREA